MAKGEELFSVSQLKERGWTDTAIRKFLPEPDTTRPNPVYSHAGAPMKFWRRRRVLRVEKTKRFLQWQAGVEERRLQGMQAAETRARNMAEGMRTVEITVQRDVSEEEIYRLAVATHGGNYQGDPGPFVWSRAKARNCIRHNLTNYEELWALCNRGETGQEAYDILRSRVDALIDEAYPQFRELEESHETND